MVKLNRGQRIILSDERREFYMKKCEEAMHVQNSKYNKKPEDPYRKKEEEIRAELEKKFDQLFGLLGDIDSDCYDEDGNITP